MLSLLKSHLELRGRSVLDGRLDVVASHFAYPLPAFLEDQRIVVASPKDMQRSLARLRQELVSRRIIRLQPEITAIDLPRAARFRVWVRWHEISADGTGDRFSDVIYYCYHSAGTIRTEMLHYTQMSMPDLRETFATLAKSA